MRILLYIAIGLVVVGVAFLAVVAVIKTGKVDELQNQLKTLPARLKRHEPKKNEESEPEPKPEPTPDETITSNPVL